MNPIPGIETPGYCRKSLRDDATAVAAAYLNTNRGAPPSSVAILRRVDGVTRPTF